MQITSFHYQVQKGTERWLYFYRGTHRVEDELYLRRIKSTFSQPFSPIGQKVPNPYARVLKNERVEMFYPFLNHPLFFIPLCNIRVTSHTIAKLKLHNKKVYVISIRFN